MNLIMVCELCPVKCDTSLKQGYLFKTVTQRKTEIKLISAAIHNGKSRCLQ
jgi:hypothetical protein